MLGHHLVHSAQIKVIYLQNNLNRHLSSMFFKTYLYDKDSTNAFGNLFWSLSILTIRKVTDIFHFAKVRYMLKLNTDSR